MDGGGDIQTASLTPSGDGNELMLTFDGTHVVFSKVGSCETADAPTCTTFDDGDGDRLGVSITGNAEASYVLRPSAGAIHDARLQRLASAVTVELLGVRIVETTLGP
jgi:hypothetical protein